MKQLKNIALALLFGAIFISSAFADGKPGSGDPGNSGKPGVNHYGLSDSCWNVFLAGLSATDAAQLAADQKTIIDNRAQIDGLNQQMGALLKNGGGKDSATRSQINALNIQIQALNKAALAAQMDMDMIVKNNHAALELVSQSCRPNKGPGDPRDTSKGKPGNGGPDKGGKGRFGLADSCWQIFLTQISADDAAKLKADQDLIAANQLQVDALSKQIRALKGSGKDSATRAQIKNLMDQIKALLKSSGEAQRDFASIIKKNEAILQSIRKDCGRPAVHKGNPGDPSNGGLTATEIKPNPATVNGSASFTITLKADAQVVVSIMNAMTNQAPKEIFNGLLSAGDHVQNLDLTGLPAGVYLVSVQSNGMVITNKLVIQ